MTQAHEALADMLMKSDENSDSRIARLAADRIHDVLTAAGYAIVPVEMDLNSKIYSDVHSWADALHNHEDCDWSKILPVLHRAMIAAAQDPKVP